MLNEKAQPNWPVGVITAASIPIIWMAAGLLIELLTWATVNLRPRTGIEDTTLENALLFGGLYLALPCGLINLIVGPYARSKERVSRRVAAFAIITGLLGILFGVLAWGLFIMISSFEF